MSTAEQPAGDKPETVDPYRFVALDSPSDVILGGALITMVEPSPGHETAYNRWYEDDHRYAGGSVGPWCFASKRWVAPRWLQELRMPKTSPLVDPITMGPYISMYWITEGHLEDYRSWAVPALFDAIIPANRGFYDRTHVYTSFHHRAFEVIFDPPPMASIHALDHPYPGLVVEVIKSETPQARADLVKWLETDFAPHYAGVAPNAGQCVGFVTIPNAPETVAHISEDPVDMQICICLLWFLKEQPQENWPGHFAEHQDLLAHVGGELLMIAPFIESVPGTNMYIDELR